MTNKTILFTLAISGLIGMGEIANAVTFNCPATIDAGLFTKGAGSTTPNSYKYYETVEHGRRVKRIMLSVSYAQHVPPNHTVTWSGSSDQDVVGWANPDSKDYTLSSVELHSTMLWTGIPKCIYAFNFSNPLFSESGSSERRSYFYSSLVATSESNCTLSGATFTCP